MCTARFLLAPYSRRKFSISIRQAWKGPLFMCMCEFGTCTKRKSLLESMRTTLKNPNPIYFFQYLKNYIKNNYFTSTNAALATNECVSLCAHCACVRIRVPLFAHLVAIMKSTYCVYSAHRLPVYVFLIIIFIFFRLAHNIQRTTSYSPFRVPAQWFTLHIRFE